MVKDARIKILHIGSRRYSTIMRKAFLILCTAILTYSADPLEKWLTSNGGRTRVEIREAAGLGNGLFAKQDIIEGDILIEVPQKLCMSPNNEMDLGHLGAFWNLVAMLVRERAKGSASFWYAYIQTLRCGDMLLRWLADTTKIYKHMKHVTI